MTTTRYAILNLAGKEVDSRPSYFQALMVAYTELGIGHFTLEERR